MFSELHLAVTSNNLEKCQDLIRSGVDVNSQTRYKVTPLLYACCQPDSYKLIKLLVKHGADVNCVDEHGFAPLLTACSHAKDVHPIQYLLDYGADPYHRTDNGSTCLIQACSNGVLEIVKKFATKETIHQLTRYGYTPFLEACSHGHLEIMKFLLEMGVYINDTPYPKNDNCLMYLFRFGPSIFHYDNQIKVIDFLLSHGLDINHQNDHGEDVWGCCLYRYHENLTFLNQHKELFDTTDMIMKIDWQLQEIFHMLRVPTKIDSRSDSTAKHTWIKTANFYGQHKLVMW